MRACSGSDESSARFIPAVGGATLPPAVQTVKGPKDCSLSLWGEGQGEGGLYTASPYRVMSPVVVALTGPRQVELLEEPARPLAPDEVRIRTLLSGVSAGTEMALYRGTNPYLHKHWDPSVRLFLSGGGETMAYPVTNWGYEEVGEIVEAGPAASLAVGKRVFGTWGHRAAHVGPASAFAHRTLPAEA